MSTWVDAVRRPGCQSSSTNPGDLGRIYESENDYADAAPEVYGEVMAAHNRFSERWGDAILGGNVLRGSDTVTTLRSNVVSVRSLPRSTEARRCRSRAR